MAEVLGTGVTGLDPWNFTSTGENQAGMYVCHKQTSRTPICFDAGPARREGLPVYQLAAFGVALAASSWDGVALPIH